MTATAVSVAPPALSWPRRGIALLGPGLLVAVGYMDPGNWATDISAGGAFGYGLLFIIVLASLAAIVLQLLSMRLGLVTGLNLAEVCRVRYGPRVNLGLWVLAQVSIIACDVAEVLGAALAIKLIFGIPIAWGILATGLSTILILGVRRSRLSITMAAVALLVAVIALCLFADLALVGVNAPAVLGGLAPDLTRLARPGAMYLAVAIVGATVMPHNLYLHSAAVQGRLGHDRSARLPGALTVASADTVVSLLLAGAVNGAILVLAVSTFRHPAAAGFDISGAYHLLDPVAGPLAALMFGVALLAAGQSSTITGGMAGQIILEGFLGLKWSQDWQIITTRALTIVPAFLSILILGDGAVGSLLILSQVVLSAQLPFAIYPLLRATGDRSLMGQHLSPLWLSGLGFGLLAAITAANIWVIWSAFPS